MIVIKNINNNVSLCVDSRGQEVVVFGKGVGFVKPPHELPLGKIERTFYDVNEQYPALLSDIPPEVVDFTARQMMDIQDHLPYETNSNLVLTLADHLSFAMERAKRGIYVPIALLAEMGIKMFRLSINWTRIYPNGDDSEPNQAGLDFYRNVFAELKKYGIEPLVTIHHYEVPYHLSDAYDGWYDRRTIDFYLNFCRTLFTEFKGTVKYWLTFNEINSAQMGIGDTLSLGLRTQDGESQGMGVVPTREQSQRRYQALHHQFVASAKAVKLAHEIDPDYQVGCMVAGGVFYPYTPNPDDALKAQVDMRMNYFCGDVQANGEYPYFTRRLFDQLGISVHMEPEDARTLKEGKVDFYSFSCYMSTCSTANPDVEKANGNAVIGVKNPHIPSSDWGWQIDSKGLRYLLNDLYGRYHLPIMIVENGLGAADTLEPDQQVHDGYRIDYLRAHIEQIREAIEDGVDVIAYTPWGCIDLISLSTGEMKKRYGFIYVDVDDKGQGTFNRYKKDSFHWYKKVIASNGEDLSQQV